ncbi:hypothetical protein BDD12DRAFT_853826 [Trichophaea hybrida]|nr:hypothetical protein BDD12DRAFT_853826 [Trichophaea hybrida]
MLFSHLRKRSVMGRAFFARYERYNWMTCVHISNYHKQKSSNSGSINRGVLAPYKSLADIVYSFVRIRKCSKLE